MKALAPALLLVAGISQAVAAETYTIDATHTYPMFEVNHLGFSLQRGRFNKTTGKITLDRDAKKGAIEAVIDVTSLDMGLEKWDAHLKSEDFFNAEKFPTMTFKSDKLKFDGVKLTGAEGTLTLLGVTKPVKLSITQFKCGEHPMNKKPLCGAEVVTTIKRSEFGMTKYVPAVGDEVKISFPVEAYKD
ncbi:MAG: hypothetical protein RIR70_152 [Pseudomonadota bacterium]|jgi:polyisoprenoid-binding protein YceI